MGAITNADYRTLNCVDTLTASFRLRRLRDFGLVEQKGRGNATYYVPTKRLLNPQAAGRTEFSRGAAGGELFGESASHISPLHDMPASHISPLHDMLPDDLAKKIESIGKRTSTQAIKQIIRGLCSVQAFTTAQIAHLLKRNPNHVRNVYLLPMIESGELEGLYPDNPTHPLQAYVTKMKDSGLAEPKK